MHKIPVFATFARQKSEEKKGEKALEKKGESPRKGKTISLTRYIQSCFSRRLYPEGILARSRLFQHVAPFGYAKNSSALNTFFFFFFHNKDGGGRR